jgi:hypothetical protein
VDPLNIYRYPNWIYNIFRFKGSPNRATPLDYKRSLERNDWTDVKIEPISILDKTYFNKIKNDLAKKFRELNTNMEYLTIIICATKK